MGKSISNISFYDSSGQSEYAFSKPYSEKTAELIDNEVKVIIDQAYERAKAVLIENKEGLIKLAQLLLDREVIFSEDLEAIFGPRKSHTRTEEVVGNMQNGNGDKQQPVIPESSNGNEEIK